MAKNESFALCLMWFSLSHLSSGKPLNRNLCRSIIIWNFSSTLRSIFRRFPRFSSISHTALCSTLVTYRFHSFAFLSCCVHSKLYSFRYELSIKISLSINNKQQSIVSQAHSGLGELQKCGVSTIRHIYWIQFKCLGSKPWRNRKKFWQQQWTENCWIQQ